MEYQSNKILTMESIPDELLKKGKKREYKKNEVLNNLSGGVYILLKGCAIESVFSDDKKQIIRFILKSPCIIGEIYTITEGESSSVYQFLKNSEVLHISRIELNNLIKKDDEVYTFIFEFLYKKMMTSLYQHDKSINMNSEIQVAGLFYEFTRNFGKEYEDYIFIDYNLNRQLIADLLGVNRTTVFRAINKLMEADLISCAGRSFIVKDLDVLFKYINGQKYHILKRGGSIEVSSL